MTVDWKADVRPAASEQFTGLSIKKAEAALSILAFNILHAVNAFGAERLTPAG